MPTRPYLAVCVLLLVLPASFAGAAPGSQAEPNAFGVGPGQRHVSTGTVSSSLAEAGRQGGRDAEGLSSDLVYAVMVGEVAEQRGDHRMAFTHYLHAARLAWDAGLAERAARAALSDEDYESARRAVAVWTEIAPDSVKAHQTAAYVHLELDERGRALEELRRVGELASTPGQGFLMAVRLLSRMPDPAARLEIMRSLTADAPADAEAQFALATLAAVADDPQAAREHAERSIALRPQWNRPVLFLVRLMVGSGENEAALEVLDEALRAQPADRELIALRAQFHIEAEEYPQALGLYDSILRAAPGEPEVLLAAAVLALEIAHLEAARGYLIELRETGGKHDETAYLMGQLEEADGNPEAALGWYATVRGENSASAQVRIAGIRAHQGQVGRARDILRELRVKHPNDATTFYLIEGEILRERSMEQEAIAVYTTGLQNAPNDADLLYARAMLAIGLGRVDRLEADLRRILVGNPDHADALNALGYTLADRTKRLDEAFRFIQRALELRPDEPAILDSMGWVLYRMGDAEAAEPYLRRALASVFDAEIAAHLGEVLWVLGRQDEARAVWQRALDADPQHEYLLRVMGHYQISRKR